MKYNNTSLVPVSVKKKQKKIKLWLNNLPIRTRLFLITFGVIVLFLVTIFLSNSLFLKPYYNSIKEKNLNSTLNRIASLDFSDTDEVGYASDKLCMQIKAMEESGNLQVIILDDSMGVFYCDSEGVISIDRFDRFSGARQWFNSLFEIQADYKGEDRKSVV